MQKQLTLTEATNQCEAMQAQIATHYANKELRRIEQAMNAIANEDVMEGLGDRVDRNEWRYDDPTFNLSGRWEAAATQADDRKGGQDRLLFQTEQDLHVMRGTGRLLVNEVEYATGILLNLTNYTVGTGSEVSAEPVPGVEVPTGLVAAVQKSIDRFMELNDWLGDRDREFYWRAVRDGETFLRITPDGADAIARFIEPEHVTEPQRPDQLEDHFDHIDADQASGWRFGVHTYERDGETTISYHVVRDTEGNDWDVFPADEIIHYKRNVDRIVKRGVSDFHAVYKILQKAEKLLGNTAEGAAIQAAIAFIRQHVKGTTQSGVQGFVAGKAFNTVSQPTPNTTGRTRHFQKYAPGTTIDTPAGMEHKPGPLGSERAPHFIAVIQAALRAAFARWAMPEFMTGDASNANYASTLVAKSPFVIGRKAEQHILKQRHKRIFWRAVRIAYDAGVFKQYGIEHFDDLKNLIDIKIDSPKVEAEDELKLAQTQQIEILSGTLSRRTAMAERSRDVDEELQQMADDPALLTTAQGEANAGLLGAITGAMESAEEDYP